MITTCRKCHEEQEHAVRPNGKPQSQCKKCQREYSKLHYEKNKDLHNGRRAARRKVELASTREAIRTIKESSPCTDCDEYYPYYVMQFDHVNGDKEFNIANALRKGLKAILKEIEKCDLVCANCHAERTWGPGEE